MKTDDIIQYGFIGLAALLVGYLLYDYLTQNKTQHQQMEMYKTYAPVADDVDAGGEETAAPVSDAQPTPNLGPVASTNQPTQMDMNCRPKDILTSADLLPNIMGSTWEQVNPQGQGSLGDQNFLTAGYNLGINTVGSSLRNANKQLRSDPIIPKSVVSPWGQSTIDPDVGRRCLEVGSDACP